MRFVVFLIGAANAAFALEGYILNSIDGRDLASAAIAGALISDSIFGRSPQ